MGKLVLSRRVGERIAIDETTFVSVERIRGDYVRLGFEAPQHVRIVRDELDRIDDAKPASPEAVNSNKEFSIDIASRHDSAFWWSGGDPVSRSQHADVAKLAGLLKDWMDNSRGVSERERDVAKPLFDALNLNVDDYI